MTRLDRFDELLDPGKAAGLRKELRRLFPPWGNGIPQGTVYLCSEPEYVGRMPVRSDILTEPGPPPRHGPEWTLAVGGSVLIRAAEAGFYLVPLEKDAKGWFAMCGTKRVDILWSTSRQCWVHTILV